MSLPSETYNSYWDFKMVKNECKKNQRRANCNVESLFKINDHPTLTQV
jgi:hypothetical protein